MTRQTTPSKFLVDFNEKWFKDKQPVVQWLNMYLEFVHQVDDIVDEDKDVSLILSNSSLARRLWSHPVYLNFKSELDVVDELINIGYLDSVKWETSGVHWKEQHADCLRHMGYNMFFAVVYLYAGKDALNEIHTIFRESAHLQHLQDNQLLSELSSRNGTSG